MPNLRTIARLIRGESGPGRFEEEVIYPFVMTPPVANDNVTTPTQFLSQGYIRFVTPSGISSGAINHGSLYIFLFLLRGTSIVSGARKALLWGGYWSNGTNERPPSSFPNIWMTRNDTVFGVLFRGTGIAAEGTYGNVQFNIGISNTPGPGAPQIWYETPGTGQGVLRSIDLGDPAAGADYTAVTVPAEVQWKIRGFAGTLVTSVAGANRHFAIDFRDTANVVVGGFVAGNRSQGGLTVIHRAPGRSQEDSTVSTNTGILLSGDVTIPAGYDVVPRTVDLQVDDNWGDGQLYVEEWAVPGVVT